VTISAEDNELIFRRGDDTVRQRAIIRVAPDGKIIELGAPAVEATGGEIIRLFTEEADGGDEALRAFCRYHLMMLSPGTFGLRPRITVLHRFIRRAFGPEAPTRLEKVLVQDGFDVEHGEAT
jgi:hypothetical protein